MSSPRTPAGPNPPSSWSSSSRTPEPSSRSTIRSRRPGTCAVRHHPVPPRQSTPTLHRRAQSAAPTTRRNHGNHDRPPARQHRRAAPAAYKTLIALSSEVRENTTAAGLDPLLVELLRIRTSQINDCSFCLRMHTRDTLKKGENPDRSPGCPPGQRPATSPRRTAPPSA
ncbi:carboxymuconolactone decarboxylase family protein [Streptomyces puniciscabiei]|uniref:carboxymuconolactone decarboxylase family protein n=1 Tax=Streptomyces puniciscabiei TaxID=164348 RepID=UPI001F1D3E1A|nr:carboxymuconolactone decarboxylase family protein [Streptomyces puniciscabiei]